MAKLEITFPTDLLKKLDLLGEHFPAIEKKMLRAGAIPLKKQMRANLKAVVGKGTETKSRSTGDLVKSVKTTKIYKVKNGDLHIKIGIYGYDRKGVPNPLKANVLEHGRSNMPAKPWLKPAIETTRSDVEKAMINKFNEEMKKL